MSPQSPQQPIRPKTAHPGRRSEQAALIPERSPEHRLTVVFDFDETLASNRDENRPVLRPGALQALKALAKNPRVEVVLWTASTERKITEALEVLQIANYFDHIIWRDPAWFSFVNTVKNLELLGRDLNSVILVENSQSNAHAQPQNALIVEHFWGTEKEDETMNTVVAVVLTALKCLDPQWAQPTPTHQVIATLLEDPDGCLWSEPESPFVRVRSRPSSPS